MNDEKYFLHNENESSSFGFPMGFGPMGSPMGSNQMPIGPMGPPMPGFGNQMPVGPLGTQLGLLNNQMPRPVVTPIEPPSTDILDQVETAPEITITHEETIPTTDQPSKPESQESRNDTQSKKKRVHFAVILGGGAVVL